MNAWGGRRPHPAVVNPVRREVDENLISLRGAWSFSTANVSVTYLCNDNSPRTMRHVYQGTGLYRKTVKIPKAWRGKRVWIKSGLIWSQG